MSWVYVKYLNACLNKDKKHNRKECVHVDKVLNYQEAKIKNRTFQIQCGDDSNYCQAQIAFSADSPEDITKIINEKRASFTPIHLVRTSSSDLEKLISNKENKDTEEGKKKCFPHSLEEPKNKNALYAKKLSIIKNEVVVPSVHTLKLRDKCSFLKPKEAPPRVQKNNPEKESNEKTEKINRKENELEEKAEEGSRKKKESKEMGQKERQNLAEEESRKETEVGQKDKQNLAEKESMKEKESKEMGQKGKQNLKSIEAEYFMEARRLHELGEKAEEQSTEKKAEKESLKEKESKEIGQKGKQNLAEEEGRKEKETKEMRQTEEGSRKEKKSKEMGQKGKQNLAEEGSMKEKESKELEHKGDKNLKSIKAECFMEALRLREQKEAENDERYLPLMSDHLKPEEENKLLKRRILELEVELRAVRALNLKYQENVFSDINNVKESLRNVNEEAKQNLADKINSGELLPVGHVDVANQKIHAGGGIWLLKRDYDFVKFRKSKRPEMFIKNIAVKIFSEETLKQCSVTGESSNAFKNSVKRPSLDMKKLNAVREISEYWMRFRKMSEHDIVQHSANVGRYIGQKIACLNRGPRKNLKRKNKQINSQSKKKSKEIISSEDETSPDDEKIMQHDLTMEHFNGDTNKIIQEDDKEPEKDDTDEFDDEIFNTINED